MKKAILFMSIIFLFSCGARKKEKSNSTEIVKTETAETKTDKSVKESNVKTTTETKTDNLSGTTIKTTTYEPIDPTKNAFVKNEAGDSIQFKNAKLVKSITTILNQLKADIKKSEVAAEKTSNDIQENKNSNQETKKEVAVLNVKRDKFNIFNLLWLLIPIGIVLVFLNKSKIVTWAKKLGGFNCI